MATLGSPAPPYSVTDPLIVSFPGLATAGYRVTSPATVEYNCIAWAASRKDRWWWPSPDGYWPSGVPSVPTVQAFAAAYGTLGYIRCATDNFEIDYEKVCIFAHPNGTPTHAARQLDNGRWTSKLGRNVDIEHATPQGLSGRDYGQPVLFMQRERSTWRKSLALVKRGYARFHRWLA